MLGVSQRAVRNLVGQRRLEVKKEKVRRRVSSSPWPPSSGCVQSAGRRIRTREAERNVVVGRVTERCERSEA